MRSLCLLALLLATVPARADVIVVDPAGGPGGTLLRATIASASNGDILLLRAGDYTDEDISVDGKLLSLVADPPGAAVTLRRLTLTLPSAPGQTCLLRGLTISPPAIAAVAPGSGLNVSGTIFGNMPCTWLEDCVAGASLQDLDGPGGLPTLATAGISCVLASQAVIVRCSGTGADGVDAVPGQVATGGGAGLQTFVTSVVVHECTFTGGAGGDGAGDGFITTNGGPGIDAAGFVSVLGGTLRGGDEGAGNGEGVKPGAGLQLGGLGSVRDVDAQPGDVVGAGTPNLPIATAPQATLTLYPAAARGLAVPSPLREGATATLALHGVRGDGAWMYVGAGGGLKEVLPKQGAFVLSSVLPGPFFVGPITDASGELDVAFQLPQLPIGMDGTIVFLQAAMTPAGGGLVTGSGSALVWVDSSL